MIIIYKVPIMSALFLFQIYTKIINKADLMSCTHFNAASQM